MTTALLSIGPSAAATGAAPLLARTRHVHLRTHPPMLVPPEFGAGPTNVDCWSEIGSAIPADVARSLERPAIDWSISDVASYGIDALVRDVYYPLLVRRGYSLGAAPFAMNEAAFRAMATHDVLITSASIGGSLVGACILQPTRRTRPERYSQPALVGDRASLDVVAAATLHDRLDARALHHATLEMLTDTAWRRVRVRESPVVTERSAARFAVHVRSAAEVAWESRNEPDFFAWQRDILTSGEAVLWFELDGAGLRARSLGERQRVEPALAALRERAWPAITWDER
jgi:hypothetical protein